MESNLAKSIFFSVICSLLVIGSVLGIVFGILQKNDTTAFNSTYTETDNAVVISELWNGKVFNVTNVSAFLKMLGNSDATTEESLSSTIGEGAINAATLRGYANAGNVAGKSIVVTLGGFKWIVTYLTKDTRGNMIATLWMADASGESTFGSNGSYYGNNAQWSSGYPASMYGTSYIAVATLNNGGIYADVSSNNSITTTKTYTSSSSHKFVEFTYSTGSFVPYIVKPKYVPYQLNSQGSEYTGLSCILMNESLATDLTGYYETNNYQGLEGYANWGEHYLWLPSMSESGYNDNHTGIWQINQAERSNSVDYMWTRSGVFYNARYLYRLNQNGDACSEYLNNEKHSVRPAMHLNITAMIDDCYNSVIYDANGGVLEGSANVKVSPGDSFTLPNVEKTGYSAEWVGKTVAEGTPISTPAELYNIRNDLSGSYYLTNDIDLSGYAEWEPLGSYTVAGNGGPYTGVFNGCGYTIRNMTIFNEQNRYYRCGLFAFTNGATIKNVVLENVSITIARVNPSAGHGALVGQADSSTITNCALSGNISITCGADGAMVGGICGDATDTLFQYLTNYAAVKGLNSDDGVDMYLGGICGYAQDCVFTSCANRGNVQMENSYDDLNLCEGGIMGISRNTESSNCYNTGNISISSASGLSIYNKYISGIIGEGGGTLKNAFNAGNVAGKHIYWDSGATDGMTISDCYYLSSVSGTAQGTAYSSVTTLASLFYNNLATKEKENWIYNNDTYPTIDYSLWTIQGSPGDVLTFEGMDDMEVTAEYTANTYTLILNGNGASNTVANQSITFGLGNTITNSFVRTGYTFAGWATSSAGAVAYDNGVNFDTLPVGANNNGATITLYASWAANTYYIKYNANGGSGTMANSTHAYGTPSKLTKNAFTRANYGFEGWATSTTGAVVYDDEQSVSNLTETAGATIQLYAVWVATTSKVTFDFAGGLAGTASVDAVVGAAMPTITIPVRKGYAFGGYYSQSEGAGTQYYASSGESAINYPASGGANKLYAKWIANASTLTELWNGSTFDKTKVKTLINMLSNSNSGSINTISESIGDTGVTAQTLRSYNKGGNVADSSIVVTLGGFDWYVSYLSKDTNGNVVATLWMTDTHSTSVYAKSSAIGTVSDFSTGYPHSMYSTSYMAVYSLNNGGQYANVTTNNSNATTTISHTASSDHMFAAFTHSSGELRPYIVQPKDISYQINSQGSNNISGYALMNECLTAGITGTYGSAYDYSSNALYAEWGKHYLWIPSFSEIGCNNNYPGIWDISIEERLNNGGYAATRSGYFSDSLKIFTINSTGKSYYNHNTFYNQKLRPAFHLNLTAVLNSVGALVTLDKQSGAGGTSTIDAYFGESLPSVALPTREGYLFGGYYTATNGGGTQYYDSEGNALVNYPASNGPKKLYAKWIAKTLVNVSANLTEAGSVLGGGYYDANQAVELIAVPKGGNGFLYWLKTDATGNELDRFTDNPLKITVGSSTEYYVAIFSSGVVDGVVVMATIGGTAKILGDNYDGLADSDTIIVVADVALEDYKFDGWYIYGKDEVLSTDLSAKLKISLVRDKVIVAKFSSVTANSNVNQDTSN